APRRVGGAGGADGAVPGLGALARAAAARRLLPRAEGGAARLAAAGHPAGLALHLPVVVDVRAALLHRGRGARLGRPGIVANAGVRRGGAQRSVLHRGGGLRENDPRAALVAVARDFGRELGDFGRPLLVVHVPPLSLGVGHTHAAHFDPALVLGLRRRAALLAVRRDRGL